MYSQIERNKRLTVWILFVFVLVVSFTLWLFSFAYFQNVYTSIFVGFIAFIISLISSFISYYTGPSIVLRLSKAHDISDDPDFADLNARFKILITKAGLPQNQKLYLIPDRALNAFATGRGPKDGHVVLTQGLLEAMTETEVDAVIAHELAHIKNYDIRLMMIVSVLAGVLTTTADFFLRSIFWSGGNNRNSKNSGNPIMLGIAIIFAILTPIIALLIQSAISRRREFLADMSSVEITRNPQSMIDALRKLQMDTKPVDSASTGTAHMYIDFPVKDAGGFFSRIFMTHPPIEARIEAIQKM